MQLDQNPFFRKPITPWYDSNPACVILILALIPVILFAVAGVWTALTEPLFSPHVWLPGTLLGLSLFLAFKVYFRLRKRNRPH